MFEGTASLDARTMRHVTTQLHHRTEPGPEASDVVLSGWSHRAPGHFSFARLRTVLAQWRDGVGDWRRLRPSIVGLNTDKSNYNVEYQFDGHVWVSKYTVERFGNRYCTCVHLANDHHFIDSPEQNVPVDLPYSHDKRHQPETGRRGWLPVVLDTSDEGDSLALERDHLMLLIDDALGVFAHIFELNDTAELEDVYVEARYGSSWCGFDLGLRCQHQTLSFKFEPGLPVVLPARSIGPSLRARLQLLRESEQAKNPSPWTEEETD